MGDKIRKRGVFFVLIFSCSFFIFAESDYELSTFFPTPEVSYKNVNSKEVSSTETEINGYLEKLDSSDQTILKASILPIDETSFPSGSADIVDFVDQSVYIAQFKPYDMSYLWTSDMDVRNSNLVVNKINLSRSLNVNGESIRFWPGLGPCTKNTVFYAGNYLAWCRDNQYLADIFEGPGMYVGAGVGFGYAEVAWDHLGGSIATAGIKIGTVSWVCCNIYEPTEPPYEPPDRADCSLLYDDMDSAYDNYESAITAYNNEYNRFRGVYNCSTSYSAGCRTKNEKRTKIAWPASSCTWNGCGDWVRTTCAATDPVSGACIAWNYDCQANRLCNESQCQTSLNTLDSLQTEVDNKYSIFVNKRDDFCNCLCSDSTDVATCLDACKLTGAP